MSQLSRRAMFQGASVLPAMGWFGDEADAQQRKATKTRIGLVTYNVAKDWDLDTLLKNLKQSGIHGVEFRTTHAHGVEPTIDALARETIKKKCADAGMEQVSLGTVCEFQSADPEVVKKNIQTCQDFIQLAKNIGARGVKVRPNGIPKDRPLTATLEQIGKSLAEVGKRAADEGVEIWMEVHGRVTSEPTNSRAIMDYCGHKNVGVTWNSNGTDIQNGSVKAGFDLLKNHIRCCHINDLWGDYPYRELFGLLDEIGYDRFTLCEVGASIKPEDGVTFLKCYAGLWKELHR